MGGLLDLVDHMAFYRSYHVNSVNVAIHLACIPVLLLTAITQFSYLQIPGVDNPYINGGSIIAISYGIFYSVLDLKLGIPSGVFITIYSFAIKYFYLNLDGSSFIHQDQLIWYSIGLHTFAWLAQFYGHGVHEKRAPALLDNLLQAVVLAPFFAVFEVAFALGYRKDLEKAMNNKAGVLIRDQKLKEKAA